MTRPRIRPEPPPLPPHDAWREVYEQVKDIALPTLFALALPTVIVLLVLLFAGCQFVSEGMASYEVEEPETVAGPAGCAIVGCVSPASETSEDEAGATESSSGQGGGETSSEGPSGSSSGEDEGSTGQEDSGLFGPCDETCAHACPAFFDGELCTEMCITDEDCPDAGVCNTEFYFCVELCENDEDCREGSTCQIHDGLEVEFCVWPDVGGSEG